MIARFRRVARPTAHFDPRTFDFTGYARPRAANLTAVSTEQIISTPGAELRESNVTGAAGRIRLDAGGAVIDCATDVPIQVSNGTAGQVLHTRITNMDLARQKTVSSGGAIGDGISRIAYCDVTGPIDAVWTGGRSTTPTRWSLVEYNHLHGPGYLTYQGFTSAGVYMTAAQWASATPWQPSTAYPVGAFVQAVNATHYVFEVMTAGTTGTTEPTSFYPTTSGQQVTDGTAVLRCVGPYEHADGIQFARAGRTWIRRNRIEGFPNAAVFIQAMVQPDDGANQPTAYVRVTDNYLTTGGLYYYIYVDSASSSGALLPSLHKPAATWQLNADAYRSRPWYITITDNWLAPRPGQTTVDGIAGVLRAGANSGTDTAIFVATEEDRDAGVAAQFGLNPADPVVLAMRTGAYDWATPPALDQAVLDQRRADGFPDNMIDARSWIVWARNRRTTDGTLIPPVYGHRTGLAGFDTNGYYLGSGRVTAEAQDEPLGIRSHRTGAPALASSLSVTLPDTISAGDRLRVILATGWQSSGPVYTPPAGWTEVATASQSNSIRVAVFERATAADGSEAGTSIGIGVTPTPSGAAYVSLSTSGDAGGTSGTPTGAATYGTSIALPGITTAHDGALGIAVTAQQVGSSTPATPSSGWTVLASQIGAQTNLTVATRDVPTAGTVAAGTWTYATAGNTAAATLAIPPA